MLVAAPAAVAAPAPWRAADGVRDALFDAQTELIVGSQASAGREVARARAAYAGRLRARLRAADRGADAAVRAALREAALAARAGDSVRLAGARGATRAALFRGAYAATLVAVERGDAAQARGWLLLREFRTATRFTRPGANATIAVQRLASGRLDARRARAAVAKDLLDAYQARLRELLDDAGRGAERDLPERRAEAAAQAEGYFEILAGALRRGPRGCGRRRRAGRLRGAPRAAALGDDGAAFAAARDRAAAALEGFTAAPFTADEAARRAQQLLRFLALVPVEYGRGVKGTTVHLDFEIQEAVAFRTGAAAAFADLRDQLAKRDRRAHRRRRGRDRPARPAGRRRERAPRRRARDRRGRGADQAASRRRSTRRCRRRGRRAPTSPTTT